MPAITRIYRTGNPRQYTIELDCGHRFTIANAEVKKQQLFVSKSQRCLECETAPLDLRQGRDK